MGWLSALLPWDSFHSREMAAAQPLERSLTLFALCLICSQIINVPNHWLQNENINYGSHSKLSKSEKYQSYFWSKTMALTRE